MSKIIVEIRSKTLDQYISKPISRKIVPFASGGDPRYVYHYPGYTVFGTKSRVARKVIVIVRTM